MRGLHNLFNTRPSSLTQYQVSPPWCSLPCNRVEVKIWKSGCPEVEDGAPHWSYVLPLLTDLAMWGGCADGTLSWDNCKECCTRHDSPVPGRPSQADRDLPREQADKPNVVPTQRPVDVVGGCIDAGQQRDSSWILQGWLKSLHLSWDSHGDEELLYMVF
jgi:hypothetical protein